MRLSYGPNVTQELYQLKFESLNTAQQQNYTTSTKPIQYISADFEIKIDI